MSVYTFCTRPRPGSNKQVNRRVRLEVCNIRSQGLKPTQVGEEHARDMWGRCDGCTEWIEDLPPESMQPCECCGTLLVKIEPGKCPVCKVRFE